MLKPTWGRLYGGDVHAGCDGRTAAGGVMEIISDGVDGLLVEPRKVEALAGALASLQDNPELRSKLGRAARETIINRFDRASVQGRCGNG